MRRAEIVQEKDNPVAGEPCQILCRRAGNLVMRQFLHAGKLRIGFSVIWVRSRFPSQFNVRMIIAIDGPSGSGKSSTARAVARALDALFIDTGAMYRAVALFLTRKGCTGSEPVTGEDLAGLDIDMEPTPDGLRILLGGEDVSTRIRDEDMSRWSSVFSAHPAVRDAMVAQQRLLARRWEAKGRHVVLEGRDIGTVVFPDAGAKFFMTADPQVRAERRARELQKRGVPADVHEILRDLQERDRRDSERAHSPLRKADDAVTVDSTAMEFEEQVDHIIRIISGNEPS